ncbi:MAG: hypothetical protein Q3X94_00410 [Oscillospiraceae bacterium]|nr:hypothetical protein [Oscillospiraceae bacterium]
MRKKKIMEETAKSVRFADGGQHDYESVERYGIGERRTSAQVCPV